MPESGRSLKNSLNLTSNISLLTSIIGGDKEIRTPDPLLARQVLSQLSYTPTQIHFECAWAFKIKQCMRAALRHTAYGPGYGSMELG